MLYVCVFVVILQALRVIMITALPNARARDARQVHEIFPYWVIFNEYS
jgi:hypothetical protein